MLEDIYNKYNVDISRLKRDYIKNPLRKISLKTCPSYEKPDKDDYRYLYIELNIPRIELSKLFGVSATIISRWNRYFKIKKSVEMIQMNVEHHFILEYGVSNFSKSKINDDIVKEKRKEKYGKEVSVIIEDKDNLKQYIIINHIRSCKELANKLNMEYEVIRKIVARNNLQEYFTRVFTKEEDEVFDILSKKFNDIKRQYKSNQYPYPCDFYIPSIDTYIEYQRYWTHYIEPYDINNSEHMSLVEKWKLKNTEQYNKAIRTWTILDPLKRQYAKDNNLNWLEFFNKEQVEEWIKCQ